MENWTVKSVDGVENQSAAEREEAVMEQHAPEAVEPQQEETYSTPTNDDGDFVVNLDQPVNTEPDAIQERETTEISLGEQAGDSQEVEQEVRVEPSQEHAIAEETPVSREDTGDELTLELVNEEHEEEPQQTVAEETYVEQVQQPQIELPEGVDKLVEFMNETGGTVEDYLNLNKDVEQMDPVDAIREYYKQKYPHYDDARIERRMNKEFAYNPDLDDEGLIQDKQDNFQDALYEAQNFLKQNKEKYYAELKSNPRHIDPEYQEAMNYYKQQQEAKESSQKQIEEFHQLTDQVFNDDFKGFDFKIGDNKFRVKVGDVEKTKNFQKDLNNFIGQYIEDGKVKNVKEYHKALYAARNVDKLAQHFYEQGRADAIKQSAAQAKNIDMKPRQDAASIVTPSGNKFRVVSGDSGNKLRIKMKQ